MTRSAAERRGRRGEGWAAWWLRLHGWRVVARRVKMPRGEIDLIVRRGATLAFVEVKWRATAAELDLAIDMYRLRRVGAAVEAVAHRYARPGDTLRVDVLLLAPGRWPRHIVNAWQPWRQRYEGLGKHMSLRVAVQMDPLESINIAGDSSFALMLAAQARGHKLWHYDVRSLAWEAGRITAWARPVRVQRVVGDHFTVEGEEARIDLGSDIDVVLMRQDPPFDLGYISAALLLDRLQGETLVINDPRSVINAPEKMFVLDYARFMPPTLVARRIDDVRGFQQKHGAVVMKPLHGNGGKAIFKVEADGTNLSAVTELFGQVWPEPFMVQPFLPEVAEGDKRIVLVDGDVAGAINRKPGVGEFRSNLAQGGYAEATTLTPREEEICAAMGPELTRRGLVFVGIDVIGGQWLTEINVTSPTGIVAIDAFNGTDTGALIWNAIEARQAAQKR